MPSPSPPEQAGACLWLRSLRRYVGARSLRQRRAGARPIDAARSGAVLVREPGPASKLARARCRSACSTQVASPRPDPSMLLLASESDALPAPIGFGRHPPDHSAASQEIIFLVNSCAFTHIGGKGHHHANNEYFHPRQAG